MDINTILSMAPMILKWGGLISTVLLIMFYGSLARHGLPKLTWAYRLLFRVVLGIIVFLSSKSLGQFVPLTIEGIPSFIVPMINTSIAAIGLSILMAISFYVFFYRERKENHLPDKTFLTNFANPKRIIGGVLLLLVIGVTITGFVTPITESDSIDLPGFGDFFKSEDPSCLNVRTVLKSMPEGELFSEDTREYQTPEKLSFLLEEYPELNLKSAAIIENNEIGSYILATLTTGSAGSEGMEDPEEIMNAKFCTIRPSDLKQCDCTSFIGIADIFAGMIKGQAEGVERDIERMEGELEGVEGMEDINIDELKDAMKELKDLEK